MSDTQIAEEDAPKCSVCSNRIVELPTNRVIATTKDGKVEYKHLALLKPLLTNMTGE